MKRDGEVFVLGREDREIPAELRRAEKPQLRIWDVGFRRFEELVRFPNLAALEVMDYTADSLAPLGALTGLRRLWIVHFPQVRSLDPLGGLTQLEELVLETLPGWDAARKRQSVESFRPLAALTGLRLLGLAGVQAEDGDLAPLAALTALRELRIGNLYSQEQLARLAGRLPRVSCRFLQPYLELDESVCRKCASKKVMLSGADVPNPKIICPACQGKKLNDWVGRFEHHRRSVT
jgi:hypothetical protein